MILEFFSNINDSVILVPVRVLFPELFQHDGSGRTRGNGHIRNRKFYLNEETFYYVRAVKHWNTVAKINLAVSIHGDTQKKLDVVLDKQLRPPVRAERLL